MFSSSLKPVLAIYITNLLLVIALPILGLISFSVVGMFFAVLLFISMNLLGITIAFHRYLAHNSFKFKSKLIERLFIFFGIISVSSSPVSWVGVHREHHKYSDTEGDPHDSNMGFWRLQFLDYHPTPYMRSEDKMIVRDLLMQSFHLLSHKYYFLIIAAYVAALFAGFGLTGIYFGFIVPQSATLFAESLTNWITHYKGIRNVWWVSAYLSEGNHLNHHDNPDKWVTGKFDPAGWVINMVRV